jgi:hypothetical protein
VILMVVGSRTKNSQRLLSALFESMPPTHLVHCGRIGAAGQALALAKEHGIASTQFWYGVNGQTAAIAAGQILACKRPDLILVFKDKLSEVVLRLKAAGVLCLRPRGRKKWKWKAA